MYTIALGVPQDDAEAVRWYRLSADQGNADAQYNLGFMYANGLGVPQDEAEAVRWYRLSADQGNALAQNNLGLRYANGLGVPQDEAEPCVGIGSQPIRGTLAQNSLGFRYANGEGVLAGRGRGRALVSALSRSGERHCAK